MVISNVIDESQIYFGADFQVTDKILIHQPTGREIIEFGEQRYYSGITMLTAIPSDMKYQLEDLGFNYMKVEDYDLFLLLSRGLTPEATKVNFGDLDFSKMELAKDDENGLPVLVDTDAGIKIDKSVYLRMAEYLRKMHGIIPKVQNAANETTRQILIQLDRDKAAKAAKEPYKSLLKTIISGLMRNPACTMSWNELLDLPINALMDTLSGVQIFTATNALLIGAHSGMVDTSKINKKEFDWMRDYEASKSSIVKENTSTKKAK
jgi:hypothetical protein